MQKSVLARSHLLFNLCSANASSSLSNLHSQELKIPIGNLHRRSTAAMDSLRREESTAETLKPSLQRRIKSAGRKVHACERGGDHVRLKNAV